MSLSYQNPPTEIDASIVLNTLNAAILVVDQQDRIHYANAAAETLLEVSAHYLCSSSMKDFLPSDSPLFSLIKQVRQSGAGVSEHAVNFESVRTKRRVMNIQISPLAEIPGWVTVSMHEQSIAFKIGAQLTHRNSARSVTAMASILAHEVKNPLSGIRGAAQLLEENCPMEDRALTRLICDEADRIVALVDRMDAFSDTGPLEFDAVNIHGVLEHVRRVSQAGFARNIRFIEHYDPSLPDVLGNRDQLIQVFLHLVKNAAEAAPTEGGEIVLSTSFQHGVRLAVPGSDSRMHLPLAISVQNNGKEIPRDIRPHLFDAFVTTKATGSGLGLALVAKVIGDHGGVIEFDSHQNRTIFRVMLPMAQNESGTKS